jgi:hypothetical protein
VKLTRCYEKRYNVGLQLLRDISIRAEGKDYLRNMLPRRQLQGFGLRASLEGALPDSFEQRSKAEDQLIHQIRKTLKRFNDSPTLDKLRLRECYGKGEIHIIVHLGLAGSDYVAIL